MRRFATVTLSALLAASATGATGVQAKAMKWMDASGAGLPAGAKMAVVSGDPSKAGDFVIRAKFPANYAVPPHSHPGDETVRVVSAGQLSYGMGDKLDRANVGSLTKGYHVTMAAGMNHYVFTTDPVEIQVSGKGPFAITYVDPKDDPRTAK
ncbi:MAG: cupin domain-containing protein [Sphingomicrobium sp.]